MGDLIIGIGGTGGKVVRALRSRIRQTRGLDKDTNQYLCIDTMAYGFFLMEIYNQISYKDAIGQDTSEDLEPEKLNSFIKSMLETEPLAIERSEYLQFLGLDTGTLNRLLANPLDKDGQYYWLRCSDLRNTFIVSEKVFQFKEGAGQYRQIGRVGAFTTADEIIGRLRAIKKRMPQKGSEAPTVHIICSLAGGTGGGNFIDVGVMARKVFGISTRTDPAANINLILLLDGAFGGDKELRGSREDMTTTTYAALRELSRLQSGPIQEVPLQFRYENVDPIILKDMTIFEQVILMDFEGPQMNEDTRQRTVYPTMAEMIDLVTAPGTGPLVNIKLINMNKKIRSAQARQPEVKDLDDTTAKAWAQDRFAPFFSTFNSFRILFPRRAYQQKAAANAIQIFLDKLIQPRPAIFNNLDLENAYTIMRKPSIGNFFVSLFGAVEAGVFELATAGEDFEEYNPALKFISKNDLQVQHFMNQSEKDMLKILGGDTGTYYQSPDAIIPDDKANKDYNLRNNLFKIMDDIRGEHFGVPTLDRFVDPNSLSLVKDGRLCVVIRNAMEDKVRDAKSEISNAITDLLKKDITALRRQHSVFKGANKIFLDVLIQYLRKRNTKILENRDKAVIVTQKTKQDYQGIDKKGRECYKASQEYIKSERDLFRESRRYLANLGQITLLEQIQDVLLKWTKVLEKKITSLHGPLDDCTFRIAGKTISGVEHQLRNWMQSDNVSIGLPSEIEPGDLTMSGFEQHITGEMLDNLFSKDNVAWDIGKDTFTLSLRHGDKDVGAGIEGFQKLIEIASNMLDDSYKDWTFFRYMSEYVCKNDDAKLERVADEIAARIKDLKGSVEADTGDARLHSEAYIVCADYTTERGGQIMMNKLRQKCNATGTSFDIISDESARYEFSIVRMDTGMVEANVPKLRECRDMYKKYIEADSVLLPLAHILPEEQNMVVREREMYSSIEAGEQRLLYPALNSVFANQRLVELFLSMFLTGFIFAPEAEVRAQTENLTDAYWCYMNAQDISNRIKGPVEDRGTFAKELQENPGKYYGHLFNLNVDLPPRQEGSISRRGEPGPDLFVAMARFVQQLDNGDEKHPRLTRFPWNMNQVLTLWKDFKLMYAKRQPGDPSKKMYDHITDMLDHWKNTAKELAGIPKDVWEGKSKEDRDRVSAFQDDARVFMRSSPLEQKENVEFLEQIRIFFQNYYSEVRPDELKKKGPWI